MNKGSIIQVSGPVIDVRFERRQLPAIREALHTRLSGRKMLMEVAQHVSADTVRCIMLSDSEGLSRGMEVEATGECISVPVGEATLGRMFNVLGEVIDGGEAVPEDCLRLPIHRKAPSFAEQQPAAQILETGI